jgi:nucleoside-diphosphate-sugar epimerase
MPPRAGLGVSRVLVTGAAGLLGRHVVRHLAAEGWSVVGLLMSAGETPEGLDAVVEGNAADPVVARRAVAGVDAIVHLAAIPAPTLGPSEVVFGQNTLATFCILDAGADAGVSRAVLASSIAAAGLSFSPHQAQPPYVPVDEEVATQAADPYALSKLTDEQTAAMTSRRSGMTTTSLRMPFLGTPYDRLGEHAALIAAKPEIGRQDLWCYLDSRDAATAIGLSLRRTGGDSLVIGVAAPENLSPYPTEALLDAYLPEVPRRRPMPGRTTAMDLTRAEAVLGFRAEHLWPVQPRDLSNRPPEEPA